MLFGAVACDEGVIPTVPSEAGVDAGKKPFDAGARDTFVPYTPLTTRCHAAPYADGGVVDDAGDGDAGDADGGTDVDGSVPLGPPQIVSYGGRILRDPRFIPITYAGDDMADQIEDFVGSVGCTDYWRAVTEEYGIHQAEMLPPIRLTDEAPTTISDLQISQYLLKQIKAQAPGFANPPKDALFAFYFPYTTKIELFGSQSCRSFDGYHSSAKLPDGTSVSYAVMARCTDGDIDEQTGTSTHEFVEASTDPDPEFAPAYLQPDNDHVGFGFLAGGEAGDLCTFNPNAMYMPDGYPFTVQRTWSNKSMLAGHDPCVPAPTAPYMAAVPDQPDEVPVQNAIGTGTTRGVAIPVGGTRTIDVHLRTDATSSLNWTLEVNDASQFIENAQRLDLSLDSTDASNGGVVHLTITRHSKSQVYGAEPFVIHSHLTGRDTFWVGVVGDPI